MKILDFINIYRTARGKNKFKITNFSFENCVKRVVPGLFSGFVTILHAPSPADGSTPTLPLQLVSVQSFCASKRLFAVSAEEFTQMRRVQVVPQRVFARKADRADFTFEGLGFLWLVHDIEVSDDTLLGDKRGGAHVTGDQALYWLHSASQPMDSLEVEIQIVGSREADLLRADVTFVLDVVFLVHLPHVPIAIALVLELLVTLVAREEGHPFMDLE